MDPESPPPAFNDLRSKFEKLALETSPARTPPTTFTSTNQDHRLLAPVPRSPRQRTQSSADMSDPPTAQQLRNSSSSSDLRKKPPPPPPPPRGTKAKSPSPIASPLLRPVPTPPTPTTSTPEPNNALPSPFKPASTMRKPPPLPARNGHEEEDSPLSGGIASLRSKFAATSSPSLPNLPSTHSTAQGGRVSSHSSVMMPASIPAPVPSATSHHAHRHSFSTVPLIPTQSPSPLIQLHSPLLKNSPEHEYGSTPPPLPSRKKPEKGRNGNQSPEQSFEAMEGASSGSSSGDTDPFLEQSPPPPQHPKRPTILPPPRPPPRHNAITTPSSGDSSQSLPFGSDSSVNSSTPTLQIPPPLPLRRSPPTTAEEPPARPSLPARRSYIAESDPISQVAAAPPPPAPPTSDRKVIGSSHLPPPPTRTIALGDKLPPPRRPPSGDSSDESGDEEEGSQKGRTIDLLPDGSRSSRRPPVIVTSPFASFKAHVTAHTGVVAVSGYHVVVAHHHVKIYDISASDIPVHNVGLKEVGLDWRVKDPRVTAMEFRHVSPEADRGCILWLGTKDGHLWEMDVRTGSIVSTKPAAHSSAITHIFRHGRTMITLDENGKASIFSPDHDGGDVRLAYTQPRVVRIADKQGFAKMLGGLLWTSGGPGTGSGGQSNGTAASSRGPIVRVYDILSPACTGKSVLPLEAVGAVTSGTILPSQPQNVYLSHEGGFISIWNIQTQDSVPECSEVVKVSASDVLSLEGIGKRLWAGGRNGMIAAYDVEHKPWIISNSWMAHNDLPVLKLIADPWSIEKCGKLCVLSVGRDEVARFWDGLLGVDWIDCELMHKETSFSTFRELKVLVVSWNIDASKPEALTGAMDNVEFLQNTLKSVDSPDIISFGFQEMIDLENRKMAAKTVLLGKKKGADGALSEKVSRSYKMWYDRLVLAVRLAMPVDCPYIVVQAENLVGLFSCIFVKYTEQVGLRDVAVSTVKRGMGGRYGNKGGIITRFVIDDSSICLINCHLAAGQTHTRTRNADVAAILDDKPLFPESEPSMDGSVAYTGGGDGSMVLDHEFVILNGDLNYRIEQRRDAAVSAIHAGDLHSLLAHDQLLKEMKFNRGFRLRSFMEGPLNFAPTYKYDRRSNEYDTSEKRRIPAWCDRVLYRSREPSRIELLHYRRYEANVSDHRPISAGFRITVKSVHHDAWMRAKAQLDELWLERQQDLLHEARTFFLSHQLI